MSGLLSMKATSEHRKEDLMKLFASTLGVPVELFTVPVLSEPREYAAAEYWRYELGAE